MIALYHVTHKIALYLDPAYTEPADRNIVRLLVARDGGGCIVRFTLDELDALQRKAATMIDDIRNGGPYGDDRRDYGTPEADPGLRRKNAVQVAGRGASSDSIPAQERRTRTRKRLHRT